MRIAQRRTKTWHFIAIVSLAVGNLAALVQRNVKRLLAYSSVAQAGYMLAGVVVGLAVDAAMPAFDFLHDAPPFGFLRHVEVEFRAAPFFGV